MGSEVLGRWQALPLADTVDLFRDAGFRWWISGGLALELHLGRSWRPHGDTDVGVLRHDVHQLRLVLDGWDIHIAAAGRLDRWSGQALTASRHQNNLWCRRTLSDPWALDVTIGDGDEPDWIFRRDPNLRVPWAEAVLNTAGEIPYLAPDLQLLYKSQGSRPKDDLDAKEAIPDLDLWHRDRLAAMLPAAHPWQQLLRSVG